MFFYVYVSGIDLILDFSSELIDPDTDPDPAIF